MKDVILTMNKEFSIASESHLPDNDPVLNCIVK